MVEKFPYNKSGHIYMRGKRSFIKGSYSMDVSGSHRNKVVWEAIEDHVANKPKDNDDIGLRRFNFNFYMNNRGEEIDR